eukprot:Pgem_evm1s10068
MAKKANIIQVGTQVIGKNKSILDMHGVVKEIIPKVANNITTYTYRISFNNGNNGEINGIFHSRAFAVCYNANNASSNTLESRSGTQASSSTHGSSSTQGLVSRFSNSTKFNDFWNMKNLGDSEISSSSESSITSDIEDNLLAEELLNPHGQLWSADTFVNQSWRIGDNCNSYRPSLSWNRNLDGLEKTPLHYFELMFPTGPPLKWMIKHTNTNLLGSGYRQTDKFEFFKLIGLLFAMTVTQVRKRRDYWSKESDGVTVGLDYEGRFHMTRHRFETLMKCVSFTTVPSLDVDYEVDDWRLVKPLIDDMNEQWAKSIIPGLYLCIDECMCAWKGRDGKYYGVFGLPHVTKIARKPKGVGLELKALACGVCGLLLVLEIQECKASMAVKDFVPEFGSGTALCLRLTKNYWNSNRIVCGDSAFSSVKTAHQMRNK